MSITRVVQLLKEKEGIRLEYKSASLALPANLFESICAMLNRDGGDILLGVDNDGTVLGIQESLCNQMMADISNLSNNPQKLNPPFILHPLKHKIVDKYILHIQIPASSQIHDSRGIVYDRSSDGDFKAKQPHQIAELHNHKRSFYSESIIYPFIQLSDFNETLFFKVRQLIRNNKPNHPWLSLDDEQLIKTAGLWRKDYHSGQEGYTLAAILLFGRDQVIHQVLPHFKIDALVRIIDKNRYDDRLYIQTNLIDAYDLLMEFIEKHLPDKFYLNEDQRISLRSKIFREIVANLIVHREYNNANPCSLIIQKNRVTCKNANNPHGEGPINPNHFAPFPKNPTLAKFFIQLGRVDELGSGVLNVHRFIKQYAGKDQPQFIEGTTFTMEIPIPIMKNEGLSEGLSEGLNEGLSEGLNSLLEIIALFPGSRTNQLTSLLENRPQKTIERQIKKLIQLERIEFIGSKKTGGYFKINKN